MDIPSVFTSIVGVFGHMFPNRSVKSVSAVETDGWAEGAEKVTVYWDKPLVLAGLYGHPMEVDPGVYIIERSVLLPNRYGVSVGHVYANAPVSFWKSRIEAGLVKVIPT